MGNTVRISLELFNQTIDLLESFNIQDFDSVIAEYYEYVLSSFLDKRKRLDLRKSYSKIVFAQNDEERLDARMNYLYDKGNMSG